MDGVSVFPKLLSLKPARVFRRGSDELRAPLWVADVVLDVPLRDLRVRSPRRPHGVRVDVRRAEAAVLGRGSVRQEHTDSGSKNDADGACSHRLVGKTHENTVGVGRDAM